MKYRLFEGRISNGRALAMAIAIVVPNRVTVAQVPISNGVIQNGHQKRSLKNQYLCKHGDIRVTSNQAGIRGSCKHNFDLSLSSFDLT